MTTDSSRWTSVDTVLVYSIDGKLVKVDGLEEDEEILEGLEAMIEAWQEYHEFGDTSALVALGILPEDSS